jgi:putative protein-disulfide isomerase
LVTPQLTLINPFFMSIFNGIHYDFENDKAEVIYVYDALCGWCYGFRPVMKELHDRFSNDVDFLVLSGGMIRDDREGPVSAIAPYIRSAYKDVEKASGVKFGEKFIDGLLNDPDAVFTSVPAARALAVMRIEKPARSLEYASDIQHGIYYEGMPASDSHGFAEIAVRYGADADAFSEKMSSSEIEEIIAYEFHLVENLGITGFPSVLIRKENKLEVLARGFITFDSLAQRLSDALEDI